MMESASDFLSLPLFHVLLPWLLGAAWVLVLGLTCLIVALYCHPSLTDRVRWALLIVGVALIIGVLLL
ncbi:hypothetical protein [Deinococcus sp. Leaf326]|uniref:hypothetical protein n=1 Tax=Deinococcus sp. Leaf326 TaxID=1736338 RepID=UPI0007003229|nr:hypothetical protein [Deinococcus sp. Leaf326]KQR02743.1 hypothetical protein ASF71_21360 [Deinococcus sp. Leaf326]